MKEANLPEPEFHTEGIFTVIFRRKSKKKYINGTVNVNEQTIINLLNTSSGLNSPEIAAEISSSLRTTKRYLKSLKDKGLVEFRGAPKKGGYFLK